MNHQIVGHKDIIMNDSMNISPVWALLGICYSIVLIYSNLLTNILPSGFGLLRPYDIMAIFVLFVAIIHSLQKRQFIMKESIILLSLSLIIVSRLISIAFASFFSYDLFWSLFTYIEAFAVAWTFIAINDTYFERYVIIALATIGIIDALIGYYQFFSSGGSVAGKGIASQGGLYGVLIPLALWGFLGICTSDIIIKRNNIIYISALIFGCIGVIVTLTRTAFLWLIMGFILAVFFVPKPLRKRFFGISITAIILILVFANIIGAKIPLLGIRIEQIFTATGSVGYRQVLWKAGLNAFLNNPITGIGSGVFGRTQTFFLSQANVWFAEGYSVLGVSFHNTVIGTLAETGLLGIFAYLSYFFATIKTTISLNRLSPSLFNKALGCTLVSMLLIDFIADASFHPISATYLGILAARYIRVSKTEQTL